MRNASIWPGKIYGETLRCIQKSFPSTYTRAAKLTTGSVAPQTLTLRRRRLCAAPAFSTCLSYSTDLAVRPSRRPPSPLCLLPCGLTPHLNALMQMSSRTRRCWAPKSTSATSTRAARGRHSGRGSRAVAPPSSRGCRLHASCSVWPAPSKDRAGRFDLRAMPSKVNPGSSVVMDHFVCAAPLPRPPAAPGCSAHLVCSEPSAQGVRARRHRRAQRGAVLTECNSDLFC